MKANELRIGNYVLDRGNKLILIDHWEYRDKISSKREENFHPLTEFVDYLKPIRLTEDRLIEFGFEKAKHWEGGTIYLKNRTHLEIRLYKGEWLAKIYYGVNVANHINLPFKGCVHELQNLYLALTGEELELIENKC